MSAYVHPCSKCLDGGNKRKYWKPKTENGQPTETSELKEMIQVLKHIWTLLFWCLMYLGVLVIITALK